MEALNRDPTLSSKNARSGLAAFVAEYQRTEGPLPYAEQLIDEALFALDEVAAELKPNQNCVEIGAGPGFLTYLLASSGINVSALEPIGPGFSQLRGPLDVIANRYKDRVSICRSRIEDFKADNAFDLAISINVFEHVDDWRSAIRNTVASLRRGGRAIILCPNYDVPYEPHFGIPILGGKVWTGRLFGSHIATHERLRGGQGLWDSINFIKASAVRDFCRKEGIPCAFDKGIVPRMFKRVSADHSFRDRRGTLAPLLTLADRVKAPLIFQWLPIRCQPYQRFTLFRS